jgi:hypothetical protein
MPCETAQLFSPIEPEVNLFGDGVLVGDVAIVNDVELPPDAGYATVFRWTSQEWVVEAILNDPNLVFEDAWHGIPAYDGKRAVLAAVHVATPPEYNVGQAYIFRRETTGWLLEATLQASDGDSDDIFGWSRAIDDDRAVISARNDEVDGLSQAGSAYVFELDPSAGQWIEVQKLTAKDPIEDALFGASVSMRDGVVAIGATGENLGAGAAYIFEDDGRKWLQSAHLVAPDATVDARFGNVFNRGDLVVVGASRAIVNNDDLGAAYVYRRVAGKWTFEAKLVDASPVGGFPWFGSRVSINQSGNQIVVGAPNDGTAALLGGATIVFDYVDGAWVQTAKLVASDPTVDASFGRPSVDGDRCLIGAPDGGPLSTGKTYVFEGFLGFDCNANGNPDACDIHHGLAIDLNLDRVPDECQSAPDLNGDGLVTGEDLGLLLLAWGECPPPLAGRGTGDEGCPADLDGDGQIDGADLGALLLAWSVAHP